MGRGASYPLAKREEIPERLRTKYTEPDGADAFRIVDDLVRRVGFVQFNLIDIARAPLKRLDLIYCQNVLIYFARERRASLLDALAEAVVLQPALEGASGDACQVGDGLVRRQATGQCGDGDPLGPVTLARREVLAGRATRWH